MVVNWGGDPFRKKKSVGPFGWLLRSLIKDCYVQWWSTFWSFLSSPHSPPENNPFTNPHPKAAACIPGSFEGRKARNKVYGFVETTLNRHYIISNNSSSIQILLYKYISYHFKSNHIISYHIYRVDTHYIHAYIMYIPVHILPTLIHT